MSPHVEVQAPEAGWGGCVTLLLMIVAVVLGCIFGPGAADRARFHFDAGTACVTHGGRKHDSTPTRTVLCRDGSRFTIAFGKAR